MEFKLPLRNKNKDIIDYCLVSKEDFNHLNQFKWSLDGKYVSRKFNGKKWRIHRYIKIEILKYNLSSKNIIDHIDNNPLNNKRDNLRVVNPSQNNRNKQKQINTTSQYMGVSYHKASKNWLVEIKFNKKRYKGFYDNEHHAGYQYNLWCKELNLHTANINNINEENIKDFILYEKIEKKENLPKNISIRSYGTYQVIINKKSKTFKTLLEAIIYRNYKLRQIQNEKQEKILNIPIKKNEYNQVIIELFNNKKEKVGETIVDEILYYDLIKCSWCLKNDGYVFNSKLGLLHRYIMNYTGDNYIDHINGNKLDNRKNNLRIVTPKQNAQNISSQKNSTSKYIGVYYSKQNKKYMSRIHVNNKTLYVGSFQSEEDAAKARDEATLEYYGEYGKLNLN